MKRFPLLLVLVGTACGPARPGSSSSSSSGDIVVDAGVPDPFQDIVTPDPSLDATTMIRRGPYLQAPALGTMTVSWHTDAPTQSIVSFGPVGGSVTRVTGTVFQQLPSTTDEVIAGNLPLGYQHEVVLTGLSAGAQYTYTVESVSEPASGTFMAPPDVGDAFDFLVMGDTRTQAAAHGRVITAMRRLVDTPGAAGPPRFIINTGDLVAVGGDEPGWDAFFRVETPLLSGVPLLPVYGNHEAILGRTFFEGFFRPPPTNTSPSERWYSARIGDVHIATIDVYALTLEPHLQWLEREMSSSNAPFKIVLLHPPFYTQSAHEPEVALRTELVPTLKAAGVQLVLTGHNHCYERWRDNGMQFIVGGGGGAPLYGIDENVDADNGTAIRSAAQSTHHYMLFHVEGRRLQAESVSVPDLARVDCFIVDADQPGVDVACP